MFICSYLFSQFSIVFVMRVLFQIRLKKKLSVEAGLVGPFFLKLRGERGGTSTKLTDFLTEVTLKSPDDAIHVTSTPILPLPHLSS